jgi:tetratricopeptide (TPR) repeat protein
MAVANVASILAREGRKVVIIDFDLEAPGLDSFEEFKNCAFKPGVVEYVAFYINEGTPASIDQYIHNCTNKSSSPGEIWVMPSGNKNENYNQQLSNINWSSLYENQKGPLFFANWKASINKKIRPDYVLVDSRTGLTDVGGICTMQLPDLVVLMFALNKQNLDGISRVSKAIQNAPVGKTPQIHYVASPLPPLVSQKTDLLHSRFEIIKADLGISLKELSIIRYAAEVAIKEKIFTVDEGVSIPILQDYQDLAKKIKKFNRSGIDFLKAQVESVLTQQDSEKALAINIILTQDFAEVADSYFLRYKLKPLVLSDNTAEDLLLKCLLINPLHGEAFSRLKDIYSKANNSRPIKIVELCDLLLSHIDGSSNLLYLLEMGNAQMGCQNYDAAINCYEKIVDKHESIISRFQELIIKFNIAEAKRLSGKTVSDRRWRDIIEIYEAIGQSEATLDIQANRYQAMHIPYFKVKNYSKSKELLLKAEASARALSELDEIFTVHLYRNVSQSEFLSINNTMLQALSEGYLIGDPNRPEI